MPAYCEGELFYFQALRGAALIPPAVVNYAASSESFCPQITPIMQRITLAKTYAEAEIYEPFSIRVTVSRENVENVVNPPQTPVFQNSTAFGEIFSFDSARPAIKPISKAPSRFVISVRNGNPLFRGIRLIAYRLTAPSAPPSAIKIMLIYFLLCIKADVYGVYLAYCSIFMLN